MDESTRGWFATQVLLAIGALPSINNLKAMLSWMQGENTRAGNNPLATTWSEYDNQGATWFNTFGDEGQYHVRNYATPEQGVEATVKTLQQGYYTDIVAALQRGTTTDELESLVQQSPWGTKNFGYVESGDYQDAFSTQLGSQSTAVSPSSSTQLESQTTVVSPDWMYGPMSSQPQYSRGQFFADALEEMGYSVPSNDPVAVFNLAKEAGLTTSDSYESFKSNNQITRGEAAIAFFRMADEELPERSAGTSWTDYQQQVLEKAVDFGLFKQVGTGGDAFKEEWFGHVADGSVEFRTAVTQEETTTSPAPTSPAPPDEDVVSPEQQRAEEEAQAERENAWDLARGMLEMAGLEALFPLVQEAIQNDQSWAYIQSQFRNPESEYYEIFTNRFPGMEERIANGYNAISVETYLQRESAFKNMMAQAGFPEDFVGGNYGEFIANDVDADEFANRINVAIQAVDEANPEVKEQLEELYGIGLDSKADLAMYFLDPSRALTVYDARKQLGAAKLSAAADTTLGDGLQVGTAEKLYQTGYSAREVSERLKEQKNFTKRLVGEGVATSRNRAGPMTSTELAAAEFGLDSDAVAELRLLRGMRRERGLRSGGAYITGAGVSGLRSST